MSAGVPAGPQYVSVNVGISDGTGWRYRVRNEPYGGDVQLMTYGGRGDLTVFVPYAQLAVLRSVLDAAQADLDALAAGEQPAAEQPDAEQSDTVQPDVERLDVEQPGGRVVNPVVEAVNVLFEYRHDLPPDVLRSLASVWVCGSVARYGEGYERFWEIDSDLFGGHDIAACEAGDDTTEDADGPDSTDGTDGATGDRQ